MRRNVLRGALALGCLLVLQSCEVDPYCLTCTEKAPVSTADGGQVDGGGGGRGSINGNAGTDAPITLPDAGMSLPDGGNVNCVRESCNDKDDDCDGKVDEDYDLEQDPSNCGGCDKECAPEHAFAGCEAGECILLGCDVGAYDVDEEPENGCEYACVPIVDTLDTICDLRDDDCDTAIDEDVDLENDTLNCGECNTVCALNNASAACAGGVCSFAGCNAGFVNADGDTDNGCELFCTPAVPAVESCNLRDDDCDAKVDEGNPGGDQSCGKESGECVAGTTQCLSGLVVCDGAVNPTTESCNGLDDDCDDLTDEHNPEGGRLCGPSVGTCSQGREECEDGALVCKNSVGPIDELCDGFDNDCDSKVDENNPESGADCGEDEGECEFGKETCRNGVIVCQGGTQPVDELCNGLDDDCDGVDDNGDPESGRLCGSGQGQCVKGRQACVDGELLCQNQTGPATELCDGLDNDCDSSIDEGNPGGGLECGSDAGECVPGEMVCVGGVYVCQGGTGPIDELCDDKDNDCDDRTDENNPQGGRLCGSGQGQCVKGSEVCSDGALVCQGGTGPSAELCDGLDNDCDAVIDNGNPGGGTPCGTEEGECEFGAEVCQGGVYVCQGGVGPADELCDMKDNDCDEEVDENNPEGGKLCGSSVGTCSPGNQACVQGSLVCTGAVGAGAEICDSLDNDCDGTTDEGNPGGGANCGSETGRCEFGTLRCQGGTFVCQGGTVPITEACDGQDNDCDGMSDENNPGAGNLCGSDVGQCSPGVEQCMNGGLACIGATPGGSESCNALDDDCDGQTDENNPGGGAACGSTVNECDPGVLTCQGGTFACIGGKGPTLEVCDTKDNDCDGMFDETFVFASDVNHCGNCTTVCAPDNATPACVSGSCRIAACDPGFFDVDLDPSTGCEVACNFVGNEICNGNDDDCDGRVDETLNVPSNFCNPNGVCTGTTATCSGATGWRCNYPASYQASEQLCDELDNDCDGRTDEGYGLLGDSCSNGVGACERTGVYICNDASDGVICDANLAGQPGDEACDDVDNDCDGDVDERVANDPLTAWRDGVDVTAIERVTVARSGGGLMEIMKYEASRPDASLEAQGTAAGYACAHPGVLPWTNVTWAEANDACCGLNPTGACPDADDENMWRLCEAPDWESACEGPSRDCEHSYATSCTTSQPMTCNGDEYDCNSSTPFDQDCLRTTGDSAFPMCGTRWAGAGTVYDLSGNAKEWTATAQGSGIYEIRGGSYTNIEAGRRCDFDFVVAPQSFAHVNTGFRCCFY